MAGDLRNNTTFELDGNVFKVVEFQHVKPGKGAAFVRTKLKNVITGAVLERTFNPSDKYPGAEIEKKVMQYLYNDGDLYYFMDNETYDQMPLNKGDIGDCMKYLKENMKGIKASPFVTIVENDSIYEEESQKVINDILSPFKDKIDSIILGCTHYPLLLNQIQSAVPVGVSVLTQGDIVAASLEDYLSRHPEIASLCSQGATIRFLTTESVQKFASSASIFLNQPIVAEHITL